jgi:putative ABC transport system substrate-binding protein
VQELQVAARPLGIQLQSLSVCDPGDLEGAFAAMSREHVEALVVLPSSIFSLHSARINELAARSRLPTIWEWREAVAEGGLLAYGPDIASLWRRAATYIVSSFSTPGTVLQCSTSMCMVVLSGLSHETWRYLSHNIC